MKLTAARGGHKEDRTAAMKHVTVRPYADPAVAARKLLEIANATEAVQDGRIYIETINGQFLFKEGGTPKEYGAGLRLAIDRGWLWKHESGTYVKFTAAGADLFA
jgi:hypothetical protein